MECKITISSHCKRLLDALVLENGKNATDIVEDGLQLYMHARPVMDRAAVDEFIARAFKPRAQESARPVRAAVIRFPRLCFKRDVIEPLGFDEPFEIVTDVGTFRMTKGQFYTDFNNVVGSQSYREVGIYHYPKLPRKAERYRVTPSRD